MEKICCHNCVVAHICLRLLSRQHHLTRIQLVFSLINLVIASSSGIHHYLQTLVVMSILLLCSLSETQENCRILHMHIAHTYVHRRGRYLYRPWHHSWVTERGKAAEAAVDALGVSLLVTCPSRVLQQNRLVRFDQKQSPWLIFAFIAYISKP